VTGGRTWVERFVADLHAARQHLEGCGFHVELESTPINVSLNAWRVAGYVGGTFSGHELIALAKRHGWAAEKDAA
jgi:hypothetical protein